MTARRPVPGEIVNRRHAALGSAPGPWIAGLLLVVSATCGWAASSVLSAEQQRRVEAGEIVLLEALPPGASESAQGGTAVALVCAAPATVWSIVVDWPGHTDLYPRVKTSEVIHADASRVRVHYTIGLGPFSFDAYMDKFPDHARRRSTWRLAEDKPSTMFSESSGYWHVDEAGSRSLVTYAVATRTIVPAFLTRGSQRDSLTATVRSLRKRAQGHDGPCVTTAR
jgi:hypothetical protein